MIECIDAGCVPYEQALRWQRVLAERRWRGIIGDQLLLLEHPPVYTLGRRDAFSDLLVEENWLKKKGMEIYKTDRGGKITYHGPGQLVGYFIFSLQDSIPVFVRKMEEMLIALLARFHLEGQRDRQYPGVWIDHRKIAALGLHVARRITTHGFSLNVSCGLKPFEYIHPCGIADREVTSLEKELEWHPSMRDVKQMLLQEACRVFRSNISVGGEGSDQAAE